MKTSVSARLWMKKIGDGLHYGVSIYYIKNQHITKYGSEANQNGEFLFDFFFMQLEWQMKKFSKNSQKPRSRSRAQISFETTFAILICLASILGNALLPYVVNRYSEMQTITNISFTILHWLISSCHVGISWLISQHCRFSEWKTTSHHVLLSTNVWNAFC